MTNGCGLVKNEGFVRENPDRFSLCARRRRTFCASFDSCFFSGEPGQAIPRGDSGMGVLPNVS